MSRTANPLYLPSRSGRRVAERRPQHRPPLGLSHPLPVHDVLEPGASFSYVEIVSGNLVCHREPGADRQFGDGDVAADPPTPLTQMVNTPIGATGSHHGPETNVIAVPHPLITAILWLSLIQLTRDAASGWSKIRDSIPRYQDPLGATSSPRDVVPPLEWDQNRLSCADISALLRPSGDAPEAPLSNLTLPPSPSLLCVIGPAQHVHVP